MNLINDVIINVTSIAGGKIVYVDTHTHTHMPCRSHGGLMDAHKESI